MKSIIIIPSRMASKRFPGKPMVNVDGTPMIQRVWQQAINSNVGEVIVACSETEVFNFIVKLGGRAILTDPNLLSGTDRIHAALLKIKNQIDFDCVINLQGDMPLIQPDQIKKVIEPIMNNYLIGTVATTLFDHERLNPNVTKIVVDWTNDKIGKAKEFFRLKDNINKNTYHHVGIYSYTKESLFNFTKLPYSKNETLLKLEQYRAMDAGINIGVIFEKDISPSIDTKEDLITVESIIRENNEKN